MCDSCAVCIGMPQRRRMHPSARSALHSSSPTSCGLGAGLATTMLGYALWWRQCWRSERVLLSHRPWVTTARRRHAPTCYGQCQHGGSVRQRQHLTRPPSCVRNHATRVQWPHSPRLWRAADGLHPGGSHTRLGLNSRNCWGGEFVRAVGHAVVVVCRPTLGRAP